MRGSGRTHSGVLLAALTLVAAGLLPGLAGPDPMAAGSLFCNQFPSQCLTYAVIAQGTGAGHATTSDGSIDCTWAGGQQSGTCTNRFIKDGSGQITLSKTFQPATGSYVCVSGGCSSGAQSFTTVTTLDSTDIVTFPLRNCAVVNPAWCHYLTFNMSGNGSGSVSTTDGFMDCQYNAGVASGVCQYGYWVGPEGGNVGVHFESHAAANSLVCESGYCSSGTGIDTSISGEATISFEVKLKPATPTPGPGATARPPTPGPGATATPASVPPSAAPVSTTEATPAATIDPAATADPSAGASVAPSVTIPGASATDANAGATDGATAAPTVPAAGDPSGGSVLLLALAIVIAGIVIAIGLAVGLRGRSNMEAPRPDPPSG